MSATMPLHVNSSIKSCISQAAAERCMNMCAIRDIEKARFGTNSYLYLVESRLYSEPRFEGGYADTDAGDSIVTHVGDTGYNDDTSDSKGDNSGDDNNNSGGSDDGNEDQVCSSD